MMHPFLRNAVHGLLLVSGGIFLFLSLLTLAGVILIELNGGQV